MGGEVTAVTAHYVYMWEFMISADHVNAFERTYGSSGEWVATLLPRTRLLA